VVSRRLEDGNQMTWLISLALLHIGLASLTFYGFYRWHTAPFPFHYDGRFYKVDEELRLDFTRGDAVLYGVLAAIPAFGFLVYVELVIVCLFQGKNWR